ncbi:hypothetical protein HMPREF1548_02187 [Clostridium sp. KLE 1755]|nr:hypothetical protein HMPREF1548_02187 [Clostridium sp. KLE 1755]
MAHDQDLLENYACVYFITVFPCIQLFLDLCLCQVNVGKFSIVFLK